MGKRKKWHLITYRRYLKMHVFSSSVWNLKSKNPLTTFHPVSRMPWLCPSILLFRRHSHRMKMTLKKPFYVSTPALIILQILTIKKQNKTNKKNLPEFCLESTQRNDIFLFTLNYGPPCTPGPFPGECWKALYHHHLPADSAGAGCNHYL